ncbi:MAG: PH domain-containing protein [Anaerolineae bacterium]|nr:PH domain-containing protein [Anaerolineae bacterium]NUQ05822.1 PH domain-containing protein [Anaerolineae bacterium]
MKNAPEKHIGTWHGTRASLGFWLKSILSLSLWYWLVHKHNRIELTTRRLMQVRGNVLTRNETSVDLEKISNIVVNKSALGSMLSYGDFVAETAGTDQAEIIFKGLNSPDRLRDTIFDIRDGKLDEVSDV